MKKIVLLSLFAFAPIMSMDPDLWYLTLKAHQAQPSILCEESIFPFEILRFIGLAGEPSTLQSALKNLIGLRKVNRSFYEESHNVSFLQEFFNVCQQPEDFSSEQFTDLKEFLITILAQDQQSTGEVHLLKALLSNNVLSNVQKCMHLCDTIAMLKFMSGFVSKDSFTEYCAGAIKAILHFYPDNNHIVDFITSKLSKRIPDIAAKIASLCESLRNNKNTEDNSLSYEAVVKALGPSNSSSVLLEEIKKRIALTCDERKLLEYASKADPDEMEDLFRQNNFNGVLLDVACLQACVTKNFSCAAMIIDTMDICRLDQNDLGKSMWVFAFRQLLMVNALMCGADQGILKALIRKMEFPHHLMLCWWLTGLREYGLPGYDKLENALEEENYFTASELDFLNACSNGNMEKVSSMTQQIIDRGAEAIFFALGSDRREIASLILSNTEALSRIRNHLPMIIGLGTMMFPDHIGFLKEHFQA